MARPPRVPSRRRARLRREAAMGGAPVHISTVVSGDPMVGATLTATSTWEGSPDLSYNWKANDMSVQNGASNLFTIAGAIVGQNLELDVTATANGQTTTVTIPIGVVEEAPGPTDITLSASSLAEGSPQGTVIGTLSATGGAAPYTFSLVDDAGGRFQISGNALQAGATATDYETATSHSITVRVTDANSLTYDEVFTITVTDVAEGSYVAPTFTWNPIDVGASAQVITRNTELQGNGVSRSNIAAKSSGKWAFRVYNPVLVAEHYIGWGSAAAAISSAFYGTDLGAAYFSDGRVIIDGVQAGSIGGYAAGSMVECAVDLDADLIWFRRTTVAGVTNDWNGTAGADPATAVGGYSIAGIPASLKPLARTNNGGRAQLDYDPAYVPPTGFSKLETATPSTFPEIMQVSGGNITSGASLTNLQVNDVVLYLAVSTGDANYKISSSNLTPVGPELVNGSTVTRLFWGRASGATVAPGLSRSGGSGGGLYSIGMSLRGARATGSPFEETGTSGSAVSGTTVVSPDLTVAGPRKILNFYGSETQAASLSTAAGWGEATDQSSGFGQHITFSDKAIEAAGAVGVETRTASTTVTAYGIHSVALVPA